MTSGRCYIQQLTEEETQHRVVTGWVAVNVRSVTISSRTELKHTERQDFFSSFCLFLSSFKEIICILVFLVDTSCLVSVIWLFSCAVYLWQVRWMTKRKKKNSFAAFSKASNCFERMQEQAVIRSSGKVFLKSVSRPCRALISGFWAEIKSGLFTCCLFMCSSYYQPRYCHFYF